MKKLQSSLDENFSFNDGEVLEIHENELNGQKKEILTGVLYKKYVFANSSYNGVWLCSNHHELFDRSYYCFDSEFGKVIIKKHDSEIIKNYLLLSEPNCSIFGIMTEKTRVFLGEIESIFKNSVSKYETL